MFGPYDEYGYKFFHPEQPFETIYPGTPAQAELVRVFDYVRLNLFILSILWRASVSSAPFYNGVNLGPYENRLRESIETFNPLEPYELPILIRRFIYPAELIPIMCPVRTRYYDRNFYQILLNGFLVLIKVDARPLPGNLWKSAIRRDSPILVLPRSYTGSPEHRIMVCAARNATI